MLEHCNNYLKDMRKPMYFSILPNCKQSCKECLRHSFEFRHSLVCQATIRSGKPNSLSGPHTALTYLTRCSMKTYPTPGYMILAYQRKCYLEPVTWEPAIASPVFCSRDWYLNPGDIRLDVLPRFLRGRGGG